MNAEVEKAVDIINGEPCMGKAAKEFLVNFLKERKINNILEFGTGSSTKMFADMDLNVVTVEHDLSYYAAIRIVCKDSKKVFPIFAIDPASYVYLSFLCLTTDMVFIDGICREEIMETIYRSDIPWNYLIVHDSEREKYQKGFDLLREIAIDLSPTDTNLFVCQRKVKK